MEDCIFCKIINKEIPADIIYEDENLLAFLDIRPVNKGHALLIPKKHAADMTSSDDETLSQLIVGVKKLAQAIMTATGAAGFNLGVNTGAASGQVVFHTHFHIIPRFANDGLKSWPHSDSEPKTRADVAAEIKKFL
ncbi:MAG TPA: HIT family protein [Candidatus Binatia bacterium]|nr:HIT family protein [Candidatus Binatia bacterium]